MGLDLAERRVNLFAEHEGALDDGQSLSAAVALWRRYHEQCEAYDRTVCTGPIGRDGIMPATPTEHGLVLRHARGQHAEMMQAAAEAQISAETMARAKEIALRFSQS